MKYRVIRTEEPISFGGWDATLEIAALTPKARRARFSTEYTVDADSTFNAAVSAEGMARGFSATQMDEDQGGARTRREQIEDTILKHTRNIRAGFLRADGGTVYNFDNQAPNHIVVYPV